MITHSRPDNRFDLYYLNPIIFYKAVERQNGSPDNAIVAFDAKYTKGKCVIYGQLIIDELRFSSVFINRNEFRNKFGNQIGFYLNPEFRNFKKSYL